jgi:integrase
MNAIAKNSRPQRSMPVSLKPEQWPNTDRLAREASKANSRSPFRKDRGGIQRSPYTTRKVEIGYGRFISFLTVHRAEQLDQHPRERLTPEILDDYFTWHIDRGYADHTVLCSFDELRAAMTRMFGGEDFSLITRPHGVALCHRLQMSRRDRPIPHQAVLLACAREVYQRGLADTNDKGRCRKIRDAVLLGLLATMAPRIETLSRLELHRHVRRNGNEWMVEITPDIHKTGRKTGRGLELPVEQEVGTWLDRYVAVERPEMLEGQMHDALWVIPGGTKMVKGSLTMQVRERTRQVLGEAIGPHAFRAALATSAAIDGSDHPMDASLLLNHTSPEMTLRHYNRANAMAAGKRHANRLKKMRMKIGK